MLFGFTFYQIAAYFLIYSCLGWCVEVAYAAVTRGKLVNRGFLSVTFEEAALQEVAAAAEQWLGQNKPQ